MRGRTRASQRASDRPVQDARGSVQSGTPLFAHGSLPGRLVLAVNADPRFAINPPWPELPRVNSVLHGRGRHYHVESYKTTLSVKSVLQGEAVWRTRRGRFRLDPSAFVVLNHGQEYALDFVPGALTETLCLFFAPGFLELVRPGAVGTSRALLDDPHGGETGPALEVVERSHAKTGPVAAALGRLQSEVCAPHVDPARLEDCFYGAAAALVRHHESTRAEMLAFPGARRATREELYKRLHCARDHLHSCYDEPLTVARVARAAALSPYHFQRLFKEAFGTTPMQYLQARRLQVARDLLMTTPLDITAICMNVGFSSLGSFSWLFRRRFGRSPRQLRQAGG
jgi:AraC-like DNA-binding protein